MVPTNAHYILKLILRNKLQHVSANHLAILRDIKYKG